ncbi:MAG: hypothetical protein ACRCYU_15975, partial [Nocardioides sp.]
ITLNRLDQAEFACRRGLDTLATLTHSATAPMPVLSIYGALQLALALTYAKAARRDEAHAALEEAAVVARRIPEVRNDYGTEFGVANVQLHAVAVAIEGGDAGLALQLAADIDVEHLSIERRTRLHIDKARAYAQRRHSGDALHELQQAEGLSPEQVQNNGSARRVARELLAILGRQAPPELLALSKRWGAV